MTAILIHLIIQIIGGGLAGYWIGTRLKDYDPRTHAIIGAIGGIILAQILRFPIPALAGGPDFGSIIGNLVASGIGGAIVTTIAGFFKEPFKY
jgi:hypothetical protein